MKTGFTTAPAARAEGRRVQEFARIARETAPDATDPRVMAMARARRGKSRPGLRRMLAVARRGEG